MAGIKVSMKFLHGKRARELSTLEVQSLLYVARDLKYVQSDEFEKLYKIAEETISLIAGFTAYLRNQPPRGL
jgi:hypothetical protein